MCAMNMELFNGICYIGAYGKLSLLRFGKRGPILHCSTLNESVYSQSKRLSSFVAGGRAYSVVEYIP